MSKKLVAFFSASGVTAAAAKILAETLNADLYEITPKIPYTKADLDWMDQNSRSSIEMRDKSSRPEIIENDAHIENYDTVFVGFPIWWYVAPTIINTFLEKYDFSDKKIILFATSGSSGYGETVKYLKGSVADTATIEEGMLQNGRQSASAWKNWASSLDV